MESQNEKNKNLGDAQADNTVERTNMPDNQVPRFRSNENSQENRVKSEAGFLSREVGEGDFGSEEARADWEKGNEGEAGNMPNSVSKEALEAKEKFPSKLQSIFHGITGTNWRTTETLEIILEGDVDVENFTNDLKSKVTELVDFTEHIDLVIKNEVSSYFQIIEINKHSTSENEAV
ncbi:hypothetical protein [Pedobacter sp. BMA]|uniref:hypothetical protein n=1 Tax=Pedobacter sp. BMA TaxID=1663685 RepID=UPI00064A9E55|nr:hypothetical protein [Pedobacter sp. BMA]KLT66717.1 hypothetical protein AB669_06010 [Pedobacter sp. BMA]